MNLADLPTHRTLAAASMRPLPARVQRHEFLLVSFETDPEALVRLLPSPLRPDFSPTATVQFGVAMTAGGDVDFGARLTVAARLYGKAVQFVVRSYAEQAPADASPFDVDARLGRVRWIIVHDTFNAIFEQAGRPLAIASLGAGSALVPAAADAHMARLLQPQVHLRRVPGVSGRPALTQLIGRTFSDFALVQARGGTAQVDLAATEAALPVRRTLGGVHLIADLMTMPALVVHDDRLRDSSVLLSSVLPVAVA
jgi:acetoacetate decarboxylase